MPLGALELIVYVLAGGLIVASVWTWMCNRVDRREQEREMRRRIEREQRWKNLR
jgi:hypothetical protein